MDRGRSGGARGRLVTSCSHCYRRKQRCDRRRPCSNCNARNIGHECYYDAEATKLYQQASRDTTDQRISLAGSATSLPRPSCAAQDQIGYSASKESNAFVESGQAFQNSGDHGRSPAYLDLDTFTWQSYWQIVSLVPAEILCGDLISFYFSDINWINGLVEEYYFKSYLNDWKEFTRKCSDSARPTNLSVELGCFPAILFQILAITIHFLPPEVNLQGLPKRDRLVLSQKYSNAGAKLVQILGNQGFAITAVQHDLLRAAWLKNRGRGIEAWHALSDSIRKAQELNLHRYGSLRNPSPEAFWYDEWKKRIWITLYVWDSNMSMLLGRPRLLNAADCDAEPPIGSDISETMGTMYPQSVLGMSFENDRTSSAVCVGLLMYSLAKIVHEIRNVGADKRVFADYSAIHNFESRMQASVKELPPPLRSPNPDTSSDSKFPILPRQREKILSAANAMIMALHRPHVRKHEHSRDMVIQAAFNVLESQQRFFELINRSHYGNFANAFFSIDAMIVLSTAVTEFPIKNLDLLQRVVLVAQQAVGRLCLIESGNELAPAGLKILRSCHQVVKDAYNRIKQQHDSESISMEEASENFSGIHLQQAGDSTHSLHHNNNDQMATNFGYGGDINIGLPTPEQEQEQQQEMDFVDYMALVDQTTENDFDVSYWMTYRQHVADEAAAAAAEAVYGGSDVSWNSY